MCYVFDSTHKEGVRMCVYACRQAYSMLFDLGSVHMPVTSARRWQSEGKAPFLFIFFLKRGFIKSTSIHGHDVRSTIHGTAISGFLLLLLHHRRCSHRSASSRSPFLRTTTSSTHPLCTGSRSRVEPGSSASQRRDKS